jgi:Zn-dependent membrane protease YugP
MREAHGWLILTFVSTMFAVFIFDSLLGIVFFISGIFMSCKALIKDYISG